MDSRGLMSNSIVDDLTNTKHNFESTENNTKTNITGKIKGQDSRPCAVINPDRIIPPQQTSDHYVKRDQCAPLQYTRPPEYGLKSVGYQHYDRNISPRQTFQENMPTAMIPHFTSGPTSENYMCNKSVVNHKEYSDFTNNVGVKYSEVPYVDQTVSEQRDLKNLDHTSINTRREIHSNPQQSWYSPLEEHSSVAHYQQPEFTNFAPPRQLHAAHAYRITAEQSSQQFPEAYNRSSNVRYEPYPIIKDRFSQPRYASNYTSTYYPPTNLLHPKYDHSKNNPPHNFHSPSYAYHQTTLKYADGKYGHSDFFPKPQNFTPNYNMHLPLNSVSLSNHPINANSIQNKFCQPDLNIGSVGAKPQIDTSKMYSMNYNSKPVHLAENVYANNIKPNYYRGNALVSGYSGMNIQSMHSYPYYRQEYLSMKPNIAGFSRNYAHASNDFFGSSSQLSPNSLPVHTNPNHTASYHHIAYQNQILNKGVDYGIRTSTNQRHKHLQKSGMLSKQEKCKDKKDIDVRQFLKMWNEDDCESNAKESTKSITPEHSTKSNCEVISNHEQLYVLGLMNVPSEELSKYEHVQKISKLPENIKGYNSIDLLNQFEEVIKSSDTKPVKKAKEVAKVVPHNIGPPRPVSPLDVEAKISQSIIHKDVKCNFEIKPCSPRENITESTLPLNYELERRQVHSCIENNLLKPNNAPDNKNALDNEKPSCQLSKSNFINSMIVNNKLPYHIQHLENNMEVCLASLPRLDNDIELSFQEVNQQFIDANKAQPFSDMLSKNLQDPKNLADESDTKSLISDETESYKLCKYRKKSNQELDRLNDFQKSVQCERKDTVIIKNPEIFDGEKAEQKLEQFFNNDITNNESCLSDLKNKHINDNYPVSESNENRQFTETNNESCLSDLENKHIDDNYPVSESNKNRQFTETVDHAVNLSLNINNNNSLDVESKDVNNKYEIQKKGNNFLNVISEKKSDTNTKPNLDNYKILDIKCNTSYSDGYYKKEPTSIIPIINTDDKSQEKDKTNKHQPSSKEEDKVVTQPPNEEEHLMISYCPGDIKYESNSKLSLDLSYKNNENSQWENSRQEDGSTNQTKFSNALALKAGDDKSRKNIGTNVENEIVTGVTADPETLQNIEEYRGSEKILICAYYNSTNVARTAFLKKTYSSVFNNLSMYLEGKMGCSSTYHTSSYNQNHSNRLVADSETEIKHDLSVVNKIYVQAEELIDKKKCDLISNENQYVVDAQEAEIPHITTYIENCCKDKCAKTRKLKRSLSDSNLLKCSHSHKEYCAMCNTKKPKYEQKHEMEISAIPTCGIIINRRNSVSEVYYDENVSFCILIEDCMITQNENSICIEEVDQTQPIQSLNDQELCNPSSILCRLSDHPSDICNSDNVDSVTSDTCTDVVNSVVVSDGFCDNDNVTTESCQEVGSSLDVPKDITNHDNINDSSDSSDQKVGNLYDVGISIEYDDNKDCNTSEPGHQEVRDIYDYGDNIQNQGSHSDVSTVVGNSEIVDNVISDNMDKGNDWVEDIACVETVVSENSRGLYELNSSPKDIVLSPYAPTNYKDDCDLASDHIDFIRPIMQEINATLNTGSFMSKITSESDKEILEHMLSSLDDLNDESTKLRPNHPIENLNNVSNVCSSPLCPTITTDEDDASNNLKFKDITSEETETNKTKCDLTNYIPEVSSTTLERTGIKIKITNYNGCMESKLEEIHAIDNQKIRYKLTEETEYLSSNVQLVKSKQLITKAAQKYIPPTSHVTSDFKLKLPLPKDFLNKLKTLKESKESPNINKTETIKPKQNIKNNYHCKKEKPKFEDVLKSIDDMQMTLHKKKTRRKIPSVIIKKSKNGEHYTNENNGFEPDLTGLKWQPWVFLENNKFVDEMVLKGRKRAIFCTKQNKFILPHIVTKHGISMRPKYFISSQKECYHSSGQLNFKIKLKQGEKIHSSLRHSSNLVHS